MVSNLLKAPRCRSAEALADNLSGQGFVLHSSSEISHGSKIRREKYSAIRILWVCFFFFFNVREPNTSSELRSMKKKCYLRNEMLSDIFLRIFKTYAVSMTTDYSSVISLYCYVFLQTQSQSPPWLMTH